MDETIDYFERMADVENRPALRSGEPVPADIRREIFDYEERLAQKVARGYQRVGPMLRAYKEGGEVPASFEDDWTEVADFRNSVPGIVDALTEKAREDAARGEPAARPAFPPIQAWSWE
jgi:hypothetical protein